VPEAYCTYAEETDNTANKVSQRKQIGIRCIYCGAFKPKIINRIFRLVLPESEIDGF